MRGPNVFSGYINKPEATAEAFDEDGWFRWDILSADLIDAPAVSCSPCSLFAMPLHA